MILGADKLRFERLASWLEQHRGLAVCGLCLLWMVPGLLGRDPWKPEEAYVFGVVHEMLSSGQWWIPNLAGEPFLRHPPLYHWTAAATGRIVPFLPEHDAVRLVNLLYGAVTLWFLSTTVGRVIGFERRWLAPLLLLGCVGILQPAHLLVPDNAVLAGFALAAYGLVTHRATLAAAALSFGCGVGIAFLARGLFSALPLLLTLLVLPLVMPSCRTREYRRFAILSGVVALPWVVIWPTGLYVRDPALFREWFSVHQMGRFWTQLPDAGRGSPVYYLKVLPWFAWPVLPFAAWAVWVGRKTFTERLGLAMPLVLFLATLLVLSIAHDKREWFALPLLIPLCLLAIQGIPELRRGAINVFFWFGIAFFVFFLAVIWFYFIAVEFGVPARVARHMANMEPGYTPRVGVVLILVSAILTSAWVLLLFNIRRSAERPFVTWAVGATVFWASIMFLMVGWVDNAKSYRPMIASLTAKLPANHRCVASLSLGESQRGLLHYFGSLSTKRVESGYRPQDCDYLLIEGTRTEGKASAPWELIWEGHRAGDDRERYRLYRHPPNLAGGTGRPQDLRSGGSP